MPRPSAQGASRRSVATAGACGVTSSVRKFPAALRALQGSLGTPLFKAIQKEGAPAAGRGFACMIGTGPDFFLAVRAPAERVGSAILSRLLSSPVLDLRRRRSSGGPAHRVGHSAHGLGGGRAGVDADRRRNRERAPYKEGGKATPALPLLRALSAVFPRPVTWPNCCARADVGGNARHCARVAAAVHPDACGAAEGVKSQATALRRRHASGGGTAGGAPTASGGWRLFCKGRRLGEAPSRGLRCKTTELRQQGGGEAGLATDGCEEWQQHGRRGGSGGGGRGSGSDGTLQRRQECRMSQQSSEPAPASSSVVTP